SALSPDGRYLYTGNYAGNVGTVSVIDTTTNTVVGTPIALPNPEGYASVATYGLVVSPDGQRLYIVDRAAAGVTVIDTVSRTVVDRIEIDGETIDVAVSADGKRLYVPD